MFQIKSYSENITIKECTTILDGSRTIVMYLRVGMLNVQTVKSYLVNPIKLGKL